MNTKCNVCQHEAGDRHVCPPMWWYFVQDEGHTGPTGSSDYKAIYAHGPGQAAQRAVAAWDSGQPVGARCCDDGEVTVWLRQQGSTTPAPLRFVVYGAMVPEYTAGPATGMAEALAHTHPTPTRGLGRVPCTDPTKMHGWADQFGGTDDPGPAALPHRGVLRINESEFPLYPDED